MAAPMDEDRPPPGDQIKHFNQPWGAREEPPTLIQYLYQKLKKPYIFIPLLVTCPLTVALVLILNTVAKDTQCPDLFPPEGITISEEPSSRPKIIWKESGSPIGYTVTICDASNPYESETAMSSCKEFSTSVPFLEFNAPAYTWYWVSVVANFICGDEILSSRPAFAEVRTAPSAPGHFALWGSSTGPTSLRIKASEPAIKNGALDICYVTLRGPGMERTFPCNDHDGTSISIWIRGLQPGTVYNATFTFGNALNGQEFTTTESTCIATELYPVEQHMDNQTWNEVSSGSPYFAAGVGSLPALAGLIVWAAIVFSLRQLH